MNNEEHTDISEILSLQLSSHGVKRVFVSPGSRNASLIDTLAKNPALTLEMIVDERSAAFAALGYCITADEPVAIVCTSGTAPLNYSPAVCEAFYRHAPLIVITADRPAEWINQDDSQTMNQTGIYHNFIKGEGDIPVLKDDSTAWYANRTINELLLTAQNGAKGPVHINIHLSNNPVRVNCTVKLSGRVVRTVNPRVDMTVKECRELAETVASPCKVMIIGGFHAPSSKLNRALSRLSAFSNIVILTETIANLHNKEFIGAIDLTLKQMNDSEIEKMRPDAVITFGGAIVSRRIKAFLRAYPPREHWHVGLNENVIDNFRSLTRMVRMQPDIFFEQFAAAMQPHRAESDYSDRWHLTGDKGSSVLTSTASKAPWSDLKAFSVFLPLIPRRWNVHFSNGTPIRYAQLFGNKEYHRCECNRGVSGIDGCTSTAIGASLAYKDVTLLVSGDMSALYDLSAFAIPQADSRFKMIVMRNGGGGIFKFVESTRSLPICDKYLFGNIRLPLNEICQGFGYEYFHAESETSLRDAFHKFMAEDSKPALLEINTPGDISAHILDKLLL